ncbi:predicted protein [Histoplasma capsulatum G186AR]|uniref:Uncharacterized protein n=1 Tax=Ajellomyces capsulatus (strain G186AR / H82 / ATCC MYA-2454 / RMSCC 2432) TaxID=447093 RepID=C0NXV9_AJECG|nr:uncharacterized protein HCBG_07753 [Histoplasma capsulatum G186AR]EEH03627.1 predicted protein [Histoplasma capsulatum G186AR]
MAKALEVPALCPSSKHRYFVNFLFDKFKTDSIIRAIVAPKRACETLEWWLSRLGGVCLALTQVDTLVKEKGYPNKRDERIETPFTAAMRRILSPPAPEYKIPCEESNRKRSQIRECWQ